MSNEHTCTIAGITDYYQGQENQKTDYATYQGNDVAYASLSYNWPLYATSFKSPSKVPYVFFFNYYNLHRISAFLSTTSCLNYRRSTARVKPPPKFSDQALQTNQLFERYTTRACFTIVIRITIHGSVTAT